MGCERRRLFKLNFYCAWLKHFPFLLYFLGVPVTKPQEVQGLLALGGPEESSGYKGYGLSMMVEILCGILSGRSSDMKHEIVSHLNR